MPTDTAIPAILTGHALRSLRDAGYSLPAALAEPIDNSLEAGANQIRIRLEEVDANKKKHVHRITVADDGGGMSPETLHHYPQVGYSSRYMSTTGMGKYGVGAKLAALNYCERIEVWSRTSAEDPWLMVYFDLREAEAAEAADQRSGIAPPAATEVPAELQDLLPAGSGTLVVWSHIDRLESGRHAQDLDQLRVDVEKELSRMFRNFLDGGIDIEINGRSLLPHDPLFLMEGTWADQKLKAFYRRKDAEPKFEPKEHYGATVIGDEMLKFMGGAVQLRVTVYPKEVTRTRGSGGDQLARDLRIPDNEGSLSFVRLDREINYTNVPRIFPKGVQNQHRFIGIEIRFTPDLDDYMGVRHVKRGVEPHGELRALIRKHLVRWIPQAEDIIQEQWGEVIRESKAAAGENAELLKAAGKANRSMPKSRTPQTGAEKEHAALMQLAKDTGHKTTKEQEDYVKSIQDLPFIIERVDFPGHNFLDIQHFSSRIIIRINERHPFCQELWLPIQSIAQAPPGSVSGDDATKTARRTIEALELLVIAYAKAESMDPDPSKFVELRDDWGKFLRSLMGKVKNVL
jgi:hypothetical protein